MNISSRRGAKHNQSRLSIGCIIQSFLLVTLSILALGYYQYYKSLQPVPSAKLIRHDEINSSGQSGHVRLKDISGNNNAKATIGYAITVSGCPKGDGERGDFGAGITDGAAVLKHSIHMNSIQNAKSGSKYDYKMYALVHPEAEHCSRPTLGPLGYEVLIRDVPVPLDQIQGKYLREKVPNNGCCGEKEFVKLHAYNLVDHPAVVHLDLDTLVMKPMDNLFDAMIDGVPKDGSNGGIPVAFGDPIVSPDASGSKQIDAFFTRDYNMAHKGMKHVGVQGGFLVLRPSNLTYEEFVSIIREGDFRSNGGWGGKGFGPFYGSMTFQGIIPYFYDQLHPGSGVELDHCVFNNMADNPRDKPTVNDVVRGNCRDGYNRPDTNDVCEDCRSRPFEEVVTTHFTLCQKPWECHAQDGDRIQERLCRKFHGEWFRIREDLETKMWGRKQVDLNNEDEVEMERGGKWQSQQFRGYCKSGGKHGYVGIKVPTNTSV